jgi:hypothetical protein
MHRRGKSFLAASAFAGAFMWSMTASAVDLVNDTWQDATRTDPASPVYAENNGLIGADADVDTNLESAWFSSPGAALTPSVGHLTMTQQSGSSSYTTFFTPSGTAVALGQGDALRVTWVFTPTGVGTDTGRGLRMALVEGVDADRRTTDGSPNSSVYSGYRVSLNVAQALPANAIEIRERTNFNVENLLVNDDRWSGGLASAGTAGATGMVDGTQYTFTWTLTRTVLDELLVEAGVTGGNIHNSGALNVSFLDPSPNNNSFIFDTFALRPSSATATAASFDTTLFKVEYIPVPEPTALGLLGLAGLALRRRQR